MTTYQFLEGQFIAPTPAGAFLAASQPGKDAARRFLLRLMGEASTPALDAGTLATLSGEPRESVGELVHRLQSLSLVQAVAEPRPAPEGALENILPPLLSRLSASGRCVLADSHGFYLAASGFAHEAAEGLSALSAALTSLHDRHASLLRANLSLHSASWGLLDASGNSQLGFWPLYLGPQTFSLVIGGVPRFNTPEFVAIVWALTRRYAPGAD